MALFMNRLPLAKSLVKAGADVNERDRSGSTLLLKIMKMGNDQGALFLLNSGANINYRFLFYN